MSDKQHDKSPPRRRAVETNDGGAVSPVASKQERLIELLLRDEGATLPAMVEQTAWQKHTVRAALTGLKKKGYGISSDKLDGVRTYRAVTPK